MTNARETNARETNAGASSVDWRKALRIYRDFLNPALLVGGHTQYQSRLQRLLNANWKGKTCCLAYIKTH